VDYKQSQPSASSRFRKPDQSELLESLSQVQPQQSGTQQPTYKTSSMHTANDILLIEDRKSSNNSYVLARIPQQMNTKQMRVSILKPARQHVHTTVQGPRMTPYVASTVS
jgi:hypothetical protein